MTLKGSSAPSRFPDNRKHKVGRRSCAGCHGQGLSWFVSGEAEELSPLGAEFDRRVLFCCLVVFINKPDVDSILCTAYFY